MNHFSRLFHVTALTSASAAAPQLRTQAPGFYRTMLGDFEITALSDGTVDLDVAKLLAEPAAKTDAALAKAFVHGPLETSVNAYLVNTGSRLVLIDAGAGTLFGPTLGKLLANLKAAGYQPEQIDDVFVTHMHPDHVGGLSANGVRVFPNATLHADKRDSDFWLSQANLDKAPADSKGFFQGAMASVNPYVAAGKYQPFEADGEPVPGIRTLASYGHTAGHTSYLVESKGQQLLVVGDLIHVAAVQFADPGVTIAFDSDAKAAALSRTAVFGMAAKDDALVGAAHLQFPGMGHLRAAGKSWQWVPVNYSTELK
jgi:glyoxylase-like metal-dependent hydrolase (beta-lactamase superfamily II)